MRMSGVPDMRSPDRWFKVYCFAEAEHAAKFMARFGGERFNPDDRGRGTAWAQWKKK
jgi:hypothetical protein